MGFVEFQNPEVTRLHSLSESRRFGHPTDRTLVGMFAAEAALSEKALVDVVQLVLDESSSTINILRYPASLLFLMRRLRPRNARAYPGGAILYWEGPFTSVAAVDPATREISARDRREFEPHIASVLEDSFAGYVNHYSVNPLLAADVVVAGYAEWAKSTMANPVNRVFVVLDHERLIGVAVIAVSGDVWEVELASISSAAQGQGNYRKLMERVLASAAEGGASRLVISTQSHNITVQRAWASMGFRPISSIETVHLVNE